MSQFSGLPPSHPSPEFPCACCGILSAVPKLTVTVLIILAIVNLLVGVILRYFVGAITDWLDVDPVPFTWVEEVGELSLAWLTLIGAAIGIRSRSISRSPCSCIDCRRRRSSGFTVSITR